MAQRVKTVEYICSTVITTLASATLRTITGATQIYIPEAISGTDFVWESCTLEVNVSDDSSTITNLTSPTIGLKLGAAAFDSVVLANAIGNSGEGQAWHLTRDCLTYFQTNWITGTTSQQWWVDVTFTGPPTANHSAKLTLTYQYDDTKTTQVKTIWIPVESTRGLLTTTPQTVGGATAVPAIKGTYLPETGITIRQIWFELWGNEATLTNAAFTVEARIGGGAWMDWWRSTATGPNSARWARGQYDVTNYPTLTAATALSLECILLTTTNRMDNVGGLIGVTYEYNATGSTTIYNSLRFGGGQQAGWLGGTTLADTDVFQSVLSIQEPAPITIKESGALLQTVDSAGFTLTVSVSGQTEQTNTFTPGTLQCGIYSVVHRLDAGGRAGNGLTLSRGKNVINLLLRSGTAFSGWNTNAIFIVNYTSGKNTNGVGQHNHSCHQLIFGNTTAGAATTNTVTSGTITPALPDTYYHLQDVSLYSGYVIGGTSLYGGYSISQELQTGEIAGDGWEELYCGTYRNDGENVNGVAYSPYVDRYLRWTGDPKINRCNFLTGRKYRYDMTGGNYINLGMWYTYHSISYTVSGSCSNYSGDGSGIPIDVYRINDTEDEHVLALTTVAGGTFSGQFINNTDTLYATARQDDTRVGRSKNGNAG